ncbi:MAG: methyltransferase type 12 [Acidimicrobiaceae bacterium]|nr:methyltransferase type 12 [Acidimicrobiaceae bacterium]
MRANIPRAYFESIYAANSDPWNFETSSYERSKYEATMAALPRARYESAFEPGCSIGVLSEMLAPRCQRLLATDIVTGALVQAAERLKGHRHVRIEERAIPEEWPRETFDLIVLSEIAYYFDEATLGDVMRLVIGSTWVGAHVIGVHWRGETDYPLRGDRVHELISETELLVPLIHLGGDEFVLDVWERRS